MIEADLVRAIRDFARELPFSMPLAGKSDEARQRVVAAADAWLKETHVA